MESQNFLEGVALTVYGCSGAGKGTFNRCFSALSGAKIIETGPYCRSHPELQKLAHNGGLAADEHILSYVEAECEKIKRGSFLFDCPRTAQQMGMAVKLFQDLGYRYIGAVYINTSQAVCVQRINTRLQEEGRLDDACPNAMKKRFDTYNAEKRGVLDMMRYHRIRPFYVNGDFDKASLERHAARIHAEIRAALQPCHSSRAAESRSLVTV